MRRHQTRYIPLNSTAIEREGGVVYTYESQNPIAPNGVVLYAIAYKGKAFKSSWHYRFRKEDEQKACIDRFFASLKASADLKAKKRAERRAAHSLTVGTIIYNSWGYDQTNIDFYEIVRTTKNGVWLKSLLQNTEETGFMCGHTTPVLGSANGPAIQHRVYVSENGNSSVNFKYGGGSVWKQGSKIACSWYA